MGISKSKRAAPKAQANENHITPLQDQLLLTRFICNKFGYDQLSELFRTLKDVQEGWTDDGYSFFFHIIKGHLGLIISTDLLATFDLRIKEYVKKLNLNRSVVIQLRYFQYISVLFTEVFLHHFFDDHKQLLKDLNEYVSVIKSDTLETMLYEEEDLEKLAFWMATGSGKTLIMHINIWQYRHYSKNSQKHDNIILITPNEGLSRQHLNEFKKSGILAYHHGEVDNTQMRLSTRESDEVRVIEITKLTETKRGGGLTVEVDTFGSNNLLFVDEGHRGASGDVWRQLRERIASNGFTFEYSATFGQIVNSAPISKRAHLLEEYSKAIVFDYSYPHFYHDGFGKDYWIANLKDETNDFSHWMILSNLLSFYEQTIIFESQQHEFSEFNIEKPLWVFVGHSVTGGKSREDRASITDVEQIVCFLDDFVSNNKEWIEKISSILEGNTGLTNQSDQDMFQSFFSYLKKIELHPEDIYKGIIENLFHGQVGERIRAVDLKTAKGEIGLSVGSGVPYFGVINIGDVKGLMKLLDEREILCTDDWLTQSLFYNINHSESEVNLLIGSRKFMEGWDSYRVASMGLMNIGKGEGSQIIQLFGRGVRLKGKNLTLKRSSHLKQFDAPANIEFLEVLNVFGVRANYMEQFRKHLKQEGIETDFEEFMIPIRIQNNFLASKLQILRPDPQVDFRKTVCVILKFDKSIHLRIDLRPKVEITKSKSEDELIIETPTVDDSDKLKKLSSLLNWDLIYLEMLKFKQIKEITNIAFTKDVLKKIVIDGDYEIICPDEYLNITRFEELKRVEDIALGLLKKYTVVFYNRARRNWEQKHLTLTVLDKNDPNLSFEGYQIRAPTGLASSIIELMEKSDEIYHKDVEEFPNIHIDRHLYQPLLISAPNIRSTPQGLNQGEIEFVKDLRNYLQENESKLAGKHVFLLRNQTRGKGVGLFKDGSGSSFYPDFILWVIDQDFQMISFVDPHGMIFSQQGFSDPKIRTHKHLKTLERELNKRSSNVKVQLTSIIISVTPYSQLCKVFGDEEYSMEEFESENILFQDDVNYIDKCMAKILDWDIEDT